MSKYIIFTILLISNFAFADIIINAKNAYSKGDYVTALPLLKKLAEEGDVDALGNVGNMYAFGQGVTKDLSIAAIYWEKAAKKGLGSAMGNLAALYASGQGGYELDMAEAAKWYKRSAEHRHFSSMLSISVMYFNGQGVPQDHIKSLAWSALAMAYSPSEAAKNKATQQTMVIAGKLTSEQRQKAQEYADSLVVLIDKNVSEYKGQ